MQVVLRVRPFSRSEMEQNQRNIVRVADTNTIIFDPDEDDDEFFFHGTKQTHRDITKRVSKNLTMTFDQVFDNQATNQDVFTFAMRPLVASVMEGYNCSAFVYGATGAGKTFTMLGNDQLPGITYLTMKELFEQIQAHSEERKFDIGISYLEVYNEQVMNLLTKRGPLKLREDANGVTVGGLELRPIYDADELLSLLALGNRNRTQHPTDANAGKYFSVKIFSCNFLCNFRANIESRLVCLQRAVAVMRYSKCTYEWQTKPATRNVQLNCRWLIWLAANVAPVRNVLANASKKVQASISHCWRLEIASINWPTARSIFHTVIQIWRVYWRTVWAAIVALSWYPTFHRRRWHTRTHTTHSNMRAGMYRTVFSQLEHLNTLAKR